MPLYEYLCPDCNRIYTFFMPTMADAAAPDCPRCGHKRLARQISLFAFVRGGTDPLAAIPAEAGEGVAGAPERDPDLYIVRGGKVVRGE